LIAPNRKIAVHAPIPIESGKKTMTVVGWLVTGIISEKKHKQLDTDRAATQKMGQRAFR